MNPACVRVQFDSQAKDIDIILRKGVKLEVELLSLATKDDNASKARLADVSMDFEFLF